MDTQMILELVGYLASALVLVSLLMTSVVKLRVINMIGSLIFAIYALLIASYPTAIMNFCLVGVNIYHLVRMAKTEKFFTLLPTRLDNSHLQYFLQYHQQDITTYFPDLTQRSPEPDVVLLVYCQMVTAGILIGRNCGDGTLEVCLDYTSPQYRDCSVGKYLYQQLQEQGYRKLVTAAASDAHNAYLVKMGFALEDGRYVKTLADHSAPGGSL